MKRTLPEILIADDADATRTFAVVTTADMGLTIYEVFDDDEAPILKGTTVVMPRGNGELLLLRADATLSVDDLNEHAERIALALEEIEFRDDRSSVEDDNDE
jgi:hypothetical protein